MRTLLFAATSVALLFVVVGPANLHAQPQPNQAASRPAAPSGNHLGIAVIDVTYILDNYARLKQASEAFKRDMENAEALLKKERDAIAKKAEKLKTFKPGTPDFKNLEEELVKAESDWKLRVNRQKGEFAERDAKNFLTAYQELSQAVKVYSDRNGISLVLRFNGARVDPTNPQAVQMELSKMVMYYHKDIDITDQVLAELNRSAAIANPPRTPQSPQRR